MTSGPEPAQAGRVSGCPGILLSGLQTRCVLCLLESRSVANAKLNLIEGVHFASVSLRSLVHSFALPFLQHSTLIAIKFQFQFL